MTVDMPGHIRVDNVSKVFQTKRGDVAALNDVSIDVEPGEILVLLGPSGCGKTTLLRCIAGLEQPTHGRISIGDRTVFDSGSGISLPPEKRDLSMVFQSYALWPHMTVHDNVAYPLKNAGVSKAETRERVAQVLEMVGLGALAQSYPGQLSGGQQQRVALARAVVGNKGVVLFDEPLSNLDAKVRERLRVEILELHEKIKFSALYVTHDQSEATALADNIAVMDVGSVAQIGTPRDVYYQPSSHHVAAFIGKANEVRGEVRSISASTCAVHTPIGDIVASLGRANVAAGDTVSVLFRPEHCRLNSNSRAGGNVLNGQVAQSMFMGSHVEYVITVNAQVLTARGPDDVRLEHGSACSLEIDPERAWVFPALQAV